MQAVGGAAGDGHIPHLADQTRIGCDMHGLEVRRSSHELAGPLAIFLEQDRQGAADLRIVERILLRQQKLLLAQQYAFDDAQIGRTLPVLFEKNGQRPGQLMGRTPYLQPVHVGADVGLIGQVRKVAVSRRTANSLHGVLA